MIISTRNTFFSFFPGPQALECQVAPHISLLATCLHVCLSETNHTPRVCKNMFHFKTYRLLQLETQTEIVSFPSACMRHLLFVLNRSKGFDSLFTENRFSTWHYLCWFELYYSRKVKNERQLHWVPMMPRNKLVLWSGNCFSCVPFTEKLYCQDDRFIRM